ncbi:MAG: STN domain-containing protein [Bacillota bacterium]
MTNNYWFNNRPKIAVSVLLIISILAGGGVFFSGTATAAALETPSPVLGATDSVLSSSSGQKITLEVRNIDLRDLLSALAVKMGVSIVLLESSPGKVTLQLKDSSPGEALELVLQNQGLAYLQQGDIIIAGKPENLRKDFFSQMVLTRFNTYFISSSELSGLIEELGLSLKSITIGANPNVIWAEGTVQELKKVRELIYAVDTAENQQSLEYKTLTLTQISPDRAVEILYEAGIEVKKFVLLDNRLLVFDRELFPRWDQVETLFESLDVQGASKQKAFVYQLKNITAKDAAERLEEFAFEEVKTITPNYEQFGKEVIVICPPYLESQVRSALVTLDGARQKVRVPVDTKTGPGAHQGLNAKRSLLSELSGVPVGSMYISSNLSGDSNAPEYVLWVEETPDKVQLIKNLIDEM